MDDIPDVSGLIFRTACFPSEAEAILECRWKGYRRYGFGSPADCQDALDGRAAHYVCEDKHNRRLVGCLRMLPFDARPFEMEAYFNISKWANNGTRPAELTRFSVPVNKRLSAIKLGLWKLAWLHAVNRGHTHFLICTTEHTKNMYETLGFVPYPGNSCSVSYAALGNTPHVAMIFDLVSAPDLYHRTRPVMHRFFCEIAHPNICLPLESR